MTARFLAHFVLLALAASAAAWLAATGPLGGSLAGHLAAAAVGAVGALLARLPLGLLLIWLGGAIGVIVELNWRLGDSPQAWAELGERVGWYAVSLAVASGTYVVGRLAILWLGRRQAIPRHRAI